MPRARCGGLGGLLVQRDTYFAVQRGRLKLREDLEQGTGELIFYLRARESGLRSSSYWRAPASEPGALGSLLAAAHGVAGIVTKRRRVFLHRNVRIHLDDVAGLGTFIELESVLDVPGEESAAEAAQALAEVIAALDLAARETIAARLPRDSGPRRPRGVHDRGLTPVAHTAVVPSSGSGRACTGPRPARRGTPPASSVSSVRLHAEVVEVQARDLLVELLRAACRPLLVLLGARVQLELREHLVGERRRHHEATGGRSRSRG